MKEIGYTKTYLNLILKKKSSRILSGQIDLMLRRVAKTSETSLLIEIHKYTVQGYSGKQEN